MNNKTFKKITYELLEVLTNYSITDDTEYPVLLIEDELINMHNTLMREAYTELKLGDDLLQLHENVPIKDFSSDVQIDGIPVSARKGLCYGEIPSLVSGIGRVNINYLGSTDLESDFTRRNIRYLTNDKGTVWKLSKPVYSIVGNKVLFDKDRLAGASYFSLIGYFYDPRQANTYNEDDQFPTPSTYKLEMLTLKHLLSVKGVTPDLINDAQRALGNIMRPPEQPKNDTE